MGMNCVALIPARSGSSRIPDKNIYPLNGHPLIAYTICTALDSGIFGGVVVSTDSYKYAEISRKYGADVMMRPLKYATETSPDIEWVSYTLSKLDYYSAFSILRPTSPFRTVDTIKRAWNEFENSDADSIRAVELCLQHPHKMWRVNGHFMNPLIESGLHSVPYQNLPEVYVQNASLEISWVYNVVNGTISGSKVKPFFTQDYEGFDINIPYDLREAEWLIETGQAKLPDIR